MDILKIFILIIVILTIIIKFIWSEENLEKWSRENLENENNYKKILDIKRRADEAQSTEEIQSLLKEIQLLKSKL